MTPHEVQERVARRVRERLDEVAMTEENRSHIYDIMTIEILTSMVEEAQTWRAMFEGDRRSVFDKIFGDF